MTKYTAKDGERLDEVVYRFYGSLAHFEDVLAVNFGLEPILKAGDVVILPEFAPKTTEQAKLW